MTKFTDLDLSASLQLGRTGRAGASGLATTLVSGAEVIELRTIERALKLRIKRIEFGSDSFCLPKTRNTLSSRTLTAMPGEMFA